MQATAAPKIDRTPTASSSKEPVAERASTSESSFSKSLDDATKARSSESSKQASKESSEKNESSSADKAQRNSESDKSAKSSDESKSSDKVDASKQSQQSGSAKAASESKDGNGETVEGEQNDIDENMQQASDLLKRLDESNAALQKEQPTEGEQAQATSKGKATSVEGEQQVGRQNDDSLTQGEKLTAKSQTAAKGEVKPANAQPSEQNGQQITASKAVAGNEQSAQAVNSDQTAANAQTASAEGKQKIQWQDDEEHTPHAIAAGSAATQNQALRNSEAAVAQNSQAAVQASSAPSYSQYQAGATDPALNPQAAMADAKAVEGKLDPTHQQAAVAAAGLHAAHQTQQKRANGQTESGAQVEAAGATAATSQTNMSGLQRLEQAQQMQAPVQIKQDVASEQLAERVQMMMSKNLKNIDIRLDPPELGRMQIRMSMNGDLANVQITVSNPAARELIEQTMPRLREMLAQNGVALAETSVQQQQSGRGQAHQGEGSAFAGRGGSGSGDAVENDEPSIQVSVPSPESGISYFA